MAKQLKLKLSILSKTFYVGKDIQKELEFLIK